MCVGEGLINISTMDFLANINKKTSSPFDWGILGRSYTYLAAEVVVFFALTLGLEYDVCKTSRISAKIEDALCGGMQLSLTFASLKCLNVYLVLCVYKPLLRPPL
jgi:hypothetical protein